MANDNNPPEGSATSDIPKLIDFTLIEGPQDMDDVAKRFLAPTASRKDFLRRFNIKLEDFVGFYGEIGTVDAPVGPLMGKDISPILGLHMTHEGSCKAHILKAPGLWHLSGKTAWVKIKDWDEVVGDDLQEKVDEMVQTLKEAAENQKKLAQEEAERTEQVQNAEEE